MPRPHPERVRRAALEMREGGACVRTIAAELGVPQSTVGDWCRMMPDDVRADLRDPERAQRRAEAVNRYLDGFLKGEVAREFGVWPSTVSAWIAASCLSRHELAARRRLLRARRGLPPKRRRRGACSRWPFGADLPGRFQ